MSKIPNENDGKVYNDKVYYECNLKMQDGRGLTDYRSNCMINNEMIYNNNIVNTYNYRNFLQNNANNLRKQMIVNQQKNCVCYGDTMIDEEFMYSCDGELCKMNEQNMNGIGVGRDYNN